MDEKQCLETVRENLTAYDRSVLQMDRRAFQIAYDKLSKDVRLTANERKFLAEVDNISTLRLVNEHNALLKAVIAALGEIGATSSDGDSALIEILDLSSQTSFDKERLSDLWLPIISTLKVTLLEGEQESELRTFVDQILEMPPDIWRGRRIKDLDRQIDQAVLAALINDDNLEQKLATRATSRRGWRLSMSLTFEFEGLSIFWIGCRHPKSLPRARHLRSMPVRGSRPNCYEPRSVPPSKRWRQRPSRRRRPSRNRRRHRCRGCRRR